MLNVERSEIPTFGKIKSLYTGKIFLILLLLVPSLIAQEFKAINVKGDCTI